MNPPRRVVTGLDAQGRSCFVIDGPSQIVAWASEQHPADNSDPTDTGTAQFSFPETGTTFIYSDFPPGFASPVHTTNTIDYIVVLAGEATIVTDTGETRLKAGDLFVDRGVSHQWRNDGDVPCRLVSVLCAAKPLGAGATGL